MVGMTCKIILSFDGCSLAKFEVIVRQSLHVVRSSALRISKRDFEFVVAGSSSSFSDIFSCRGVREVSGRNPCRSHSSEWEARSHRVPRTCFRVRLIDASRTSEAVPYPTAMPTIFAAPLTEVMFAAGEQVASRRAAPKPTSHPRPSQPANNACTRRSCRRAAAHLPRHVDSPTHISRWRIPTESSDSSPIEAWDEG